MRYTFKTTLSLAIILLLGSSCQKVIDVDLNNSDPAYIVSGEITDAPGPYFVTIAQSKNFDEDNNFPAVAGAVTIIRDVTAGSTDTLTEVSPGRYRTNTTVGVAGHTYELKVFTADKMFTAESVMPLDLVTIDSMYMRVSDFGGDNYFVVPVYTDPPEFGNRYLLRQFINGVLVKGTRARSDEVTNGETSEFPFYYNTDEEEGDPLIKNGDTVTVDLLSTDEGVYEFYRTLDETIDQNSGTPANPLSNVKGGAIGIFNAARKHTKSIVAEF